MGKTQVGPAQYVLAVEGSYLHPEPQSESVTEVEPDPSPFYAFDSVGFGVKLFTTYVRQTNVNPKHITWSPQVACSVQQVC